MKHRLLLFVFLLWGAMGIATAQNIVVKGTVKDSAGEPVIGATVIEKGNPGNGISTDLDGNFALTVAKGKTLQVSFIGFTTQEVAATAGAPIEVVLQEDAVAADEVHLTGGEVCRLNGGQRSLGKDLAQSEIQLAQPVHRTGFGAEGGENLPAQRLGDGQGDKTQQFPVQSGGYARKAHAGGVDAVGTGAAH